MSFWSDKNVMVTGGRGFLGTHLVPELETLGANVFVPERKDYDLREGAAIDAALEDSKPEVIIHLAASVGGIGANQANPAVYFYDNVMMGTQLMHKAYEKGVSKLVSLATICSYPKFTPAPFQEDSIWEGYPEETNAPYGLAKKMLLVQAQAYRLQYAFNAVTLFPANLYGPGDDFSESSSHVIAALIRKMVEAKQAGRKEVEVWGTGEATREFLYVNDLVRAVILATEKYDAAEPVNIGTGQEISIKKLAEQIAKTVGFDGELVFNSNYPDGQPRRVLDTTRAKTEFGFEATVSLDQGLERTLQWFLENQATIV